MENNPHDEKIITALNKLNHGRRGDTVAISAESIRFSSIPVSRLAEMLNFDVNVGPDPNSSGRTITRCAKKPMTRPAYS